MGDMADWIIENGELEPLFDYVILSCKYCGQSGLHWGMYEGVWRLHDHEGEVHTCKAYKKES